jgi:hypothetical protein
MRITYAFSDASPGTRVEVRVEGDPATTYGCHVVHGQGIGLSGLKEAQAAFGTPT